VFLDRRFSLTMTGWNRGPSRVFLLRILRYFIPRFVRTNAVQFPPRQGRFDQVGSIHCTISLTGTDQRVHSRR